MGASTADEFEHMIQEATIEARHRHKTRKFYHHSPALTHSESDHSGDTLCKMLQFDEELMEMNDSGYGNSTLCSNLSGFVSPLGALYTMNYVWILTLGKESKPKHQSTPTFDLATVYIGNGQMPAKMIPCAKLVWPVILGAFIASMVNFYVMMTTKTTC